MRVSRLLRTAGIVSKERRRSPRVVCRLRCTLLVKRRRVQARVLDVSGEPESDPQDDTLKLFRVRVKAQTEPRTRTLTLGAVSAAEARVLAKAGLEGEWMVLEVTPA